MADRKGIFNLLRFNREEEGMILAVALTEMVVFQGRGCELGYHDRKFIPISGVGGGTAVKPRLPGFGNTA